MHTPLSPKPAADGRLPGSRPLPRASPPRDSTADRFSERACDSASERASNADAPDVLGWGQGWRLRRQADQRLRARLAQRLSQRLAWRWQPQTIAGRPISLAVAADPDGLLEAACRQPTATVDPFWAQTWPAAAALDWYFQRHPPQPGMPLLELGCGSGAGGLAALLRGAHVSFTDGATPPLLLLRMTLLNLAAENLPTACRRGRYTIRRLRFGHDRIAGRPFPLVVASDVTYARELWPGLLLTLRQQLSDGGQAILADPYRSVTDEFCRWAVEQRWRVSQTEVDELDFRVRLIRLRPADP